MTPEARAREDFGTGTDDDNDVVTSSTPSIPVAPSGPMPSPGTYFIHATDTDRVKIGHAANARSRLRDLSAGSAYPLRLLAVIPEREADVHGWFWQERLRYPRTRDTGIATGTEWFRVSRRMVRLIALSAGWRDVHAVEALVSRFAMHDDCSCRCRECAVAVGKRRRNEQGARFSVYDRHGLHVGAYEHESYGDPDPRVTIGACSRTRAWEEHPLDCAP